LSSKTPLQIMPSGPALTAPPLGAKPGDLPHRFLHV